MAVNITKEMTMGELLSIDRGVAVVLMNAGMHCICLLYTSDAADDLLCVDLGGRRIIKKKKNEIIDGLKLQQNL